MARLFKKYDLISVPVVGDGDRLVGRITVDDIVDVMEEESIEDLMRMGGVERPETGCMVLCFSTGIRMAENPGPDWIHELPVMTESDVSTLAMAAIETAEESVLNALFSAEPTKDKNGHIIPALPIQQAVKLIKKEKSAQEVLDAFVESANNHMGKDKEFDDDVTVAVFKIL